MPFRPILQGLVHRHPDVVHGAIFCDADGERVDAVHRDGFDAFQLDLTGAACAAIIPFLPPSSQMRVALETQTVWVATVDGGYYLVAVCKRDFAAAVRDALPAVVAALASHM